MIRQCCCAFCPSILIVALFTAPRSFAQEAPPSVQATPLVVEANINAVTLYRGRASVTRSATVTLNAGVYDLQFANLPESVQPSTLQARASGSAGLKVIGVDFAQEAAATSSSPQIVELDAQIETLQQALKEIAEQRGLLQSQEEFITSISVKATGQAGEHAGTEKLDVEALRKLMDFVSQERTKLLASRRELDAKQRDLEKQLHVVQAKRQALAGGSNANRTAVVSVVASESAQATIDLTYLVANATWEPTYNIRAAVDGSTALIEYDAMLTQRTGEDWNDVALTLSTAQPMVAANPPMIEPWFVDIQRDAVIASERYRAMEMPAAKAPLSPAATLDQADLQALSADAQVSGGGPSVTFQLPRAVTVKTNIQRQQRTRIAGIDTHPNFIHVAVPMLSDAVYLRGNLVNSSAFQFLPGRASIFVGQDYVGPTTMESVAPNGEFKVHFGIDQSVKAGRQMVSKNTENTGLLSGGRRTTYTYRLSVDNGSGKPITVELWDRYPISRNQEIQIELVDLSAPVSNDAYYTAHEQPQGLLKWILNVPPGATGRTAEIVSYGVHINRAKDIQMTPLPE